MKTLATDSRFLGGDDVFIARNGKVLVFAFGQSNAEDHDLVSNLSAANAFYATNYTNVQELSKQDWTFADDPIVWQTTAQQGIGSTQFNPTGGSLVPCIGFGASMMHDLDIARANGFAFARMAIGGSKSTHWDPAGTYPTIPPNLFSICVSYIQSSMVTLGCSSLVLVWEQGESDAKNTTDGTNYQAWLGTFVTALRSNLGSIGPGGTVVPFVFGKLNADANAATYLGLTQLRTSQVNYAAGDARSTLVSQDSIPQSSGKFDGTHYSSNGYVDVGHLFSVAIAPYCGLRIQPVSSFTYVPTALAVAFTDTSVSYGDTVTAWDWDWGDGTAHGTTQNPSHTYAGSGTYNVTLKVTNSHSDTNTCSPVAVSVISGIAGVTRDALSGWYVPATSGEWTTFLTAISSTMSTPDALWLMQEASGNPADSIGTFTLTAQNTPAYQQAVTGWTRKAITFVDGTSKRLLTTSASLPDVSTTSCLVLAFVLHPASAPAAARNIIEVGTSAATRADIQIATTGKEQTQSTTTNSANAATGTCDGAVHLVLIEVNRTGTAVIGATELDKMLPTVGAGMTGKNITFGGTTAGNTAFGGGVLYAAMWSGAKAEQTSTVLKTLCNGLTGLTMPWS